MIDQWFKQDIDEILGEHTRMVVTDKGGNGQFLVDSLHTGYTVITAGNDTEELHARYIAEKDDADKNVVFYFTQGKDNLRFLYEYAETGGCIVLDDMEQYVNDKVWQHLKENPKVDSKVLVLAARLSFGKDEKWWKKVVEGLEDPFNIQKNILLFLANPTAYKNKEKEVWALLVEKLCALSGLTYNGQSAETLASELMNVLFNRLVDNSLQGELLDLYTSLTNRIDMQHVIDEALNSWQLPKDADFRKANASHCFAKLDEAMMRSLAKAINDGASTDDYAAYIAKRLSNHVADAYKPSWLKDIQILITFSTDGLSSVSDINSLAVWYRDRFTPLDAAMRHLYQVWLSEKDVIRPLQFLYEQYEKELLDKWFAYSDSYHPNQQGFIADKLNAAGRVAVIVGDGLRLSIAETVRRNYPNKSVKIEPDLLLAALPSVTENGMSALYGCEQQTTMAQERIDNLKKQVDGVEVMMLDDLNDSVTARKLVLRFGDIDQVGEKKQLNALKDISKYEQLLTEKIEQLLKMGFDHVWLTTDHGFVLTGILDEADKQPVPAQPVRKVEERFILADSPLRGEKLIERHDTFFDTKYQYYAKTDKPFRSVGSYGYAHGGFTPQECVIPAYDFTSEAVDNLVSVHILNKKDLTDVAGTTFVVKLRAEGDASNLFGSERKVKVIVYENDKAVQTSPTINARTGQDIVELEFDMVDNGKVVVVDATTKEQLDSTPLRKSDARDLDGLF